jgi:hypothetical protein
MCVDRSHRRGRKLPLIAPWSRARSNCLNVLGRFNLYKHKGLLARIPLVAVRGTSTVYQGVELCRRRAFANPGTCAVRTPPRKDLPMYLHFR